MTTYLDKLPIEFEEAVSRYLDIESLIQFRLVNKHLYEVSLPVFREHFREVKATWSAAGMKKVIDISQSSLLQSVVQSIWIVVYSPRKLTSDHDVQYDFENHSLGSTMMSFAMSKLHNCTSVRLSSAKGATFHHTRIGQVLMGTNECLTVWSIIQHAFNLCRRPLHAINLQLTGELEYIHALPWIQSTIRRLHMDVQECRDFDRNIGYLESGEREFVLNMKALKWLMLKTSDEDSFYGFWRKAHFPELETARLYICTDTTRLSAVTLFIKRHKKLLHFTASVQGSIEEDTPKFAKYCRKQDQLETFWIDIRQGGRVVESFDCKDDFEIDQLESFASESEELLNFDAGDECEGFGGDDDD
ncbi:hypothetical protein E2P81_ATG01999 [Venturia nashicola]|nr:hypothetical protein E2P81_ATG01999 [Venturia nashicola]